MMDGALERFTAIVQAAPRPRAAVHRRRHARRVRRRGSQRRRRRERRARRAGDHRRRAGAVAPTSGAATACPTSTVRAGVHTGTVLLGGGVDAESSIRGATVNVAARMEQSAPPGRLRISHDTYRHVRGLFEFSEPAADQRQGRRAAAAQLPGRACQAARVPRRESRHRGRAHAAWSAAKPSSSVVRATFAATVQRARRRARSRSSARPASARAGCSPSSSRRWICDACWLLLGRAHPRSALHPYGVLRDMLLGPGADRRERLRRSGAPEADRRAWRRCFATRAKRRSTCSAI